MIAEETYDSFNIIAGCTPTKALIIKIMEKYASVQCQKRDELIKAQDEVIKILQEQSTYDGEYSLTDLINKIKQLKNEIQ